jgi:transcriptional regulator with XRE-family HTH domain
MAELLISGPEDQHESKSARDAWTEPAGGLSRRPFMSEVERVYSAYAQQLEPFSTHYVVLTGVLTGTGIDYCGANFIFTQLAGWTCPAAMTVTASKRANNEPAALTRLRGLHSGFLELSADDGPVTPSSPQEMVRWLYEESGLTWDQLARTLGVSRRSVHAWSGGQRVSGRNLERLSNVYSTIYAIAASSAEDRRHTLFSPRSDLQPNLFDQLVIQARKAVPPRDENALLRRLGIAPAN